MANKGNDSGSEPTVVSRPEPSDIEILREHLEPKYSVEKKLGSGGMADVYLGFHNLLKRKVAIKVLPKAFARDEGMVDRFLREAESAAQLEHPNIIRIYDVGVAGPLNYFIMAYVPGGTLKDRMRREKTLKAGAASMIIQQICRALQYAHSKGVVHRDIKPDNIMFDELGDAVLTDFGIAKAKFASRMTATGTLIGTPHYMSPEQLKGKEVDGRSDIYSLGIMFYEALTGRVPFEGDDTYAVGLKHIQEAPLPPMKLNNQIPKPLNDIVLTMLAKNSESRYQSAALAEQALEDFQKGNSAGISAAEHSAEMAESTWRLERSRIEEDFALMRDTLGEVEPGVTPPPLDKVEEKITARDGAVFSSPPPVSPRATGGTDSPPPIKDVWGSAVGADQSVSDFLQGGNLKWILIGIGGAAVLITIIVVIVLAAIG